MAEELAELTALSPQSPQLPEQEAVRGMPPVRDAIQTLELWLVDAQPPEAFVLGDTPLPQDDLKGGFSVPLSRSLAVLAIPTVTVQSGLNRRAASRSEVKAINRWQSDNALEMIVGPSAELLESL